MDTRLLPTAVYLPRQSDSMQHLQILFRQYNCPFDSTLHGYMGLTIRGWSILRRMWISPCPTATVFHNS